MIDRAKVILKLLVLVFALALEAVCHTGGLCAADISQAFLQGVTGEKIG